MLIQVISAADPRTVAEVIAHYAAIGYRARGKCQRGVCYLQLWQETYPDRTAAPAAPVQAGH